MFDGDDEEGYAQMGASSCVAIVELEADKEGTSTLNVKFHPASADDMPVVRTAAAYDGHLDEVLTLCKMCLCLLVSLYIVY